MLNQHYLGIHACVMRLEIAVQVEGGAKTICAPPTAGNEIKRRRADSSDSPLSSSLPCVRGKCPDKSLLCLQVATSSA